MFVSAITVQKLSNKFLILCKTVSSLAQTLPIVSFPFPMSKVAKSATPAKPSKIVSRSAPSPPKRALTAYFLYRNDVFSDVRKDNPEAKMTELTRIISDMWNSLDKKQKQHYELNYQKNKAKYTRDLEAYENKYGAVPPKRRKSKAK